MGCGAQIWLQPVLALQAHKQLQTHSGWFVMGLQTSWWQVLHDVHACAPMHMCISSRTRHRLSAQYLRLIQHQEPTSAMSPSSEHCALHLSDGCQHCMCETVQPKNAHVGGCSAVLPGRRSRSLHRCSRAGSAEQGGSTCCRNHWRGCQRAAHHQCSCDSRHLRGWRSRAGAGGA